jgi:hypothetical protein
MEKQLLDWHSRSEEHLTPSQRLSPFLSVLQVDLALAGIAAKAKRVGWIFLTL